MSVELVYNCEKERIHRREDAAICCLHCSLLNAGLKCIGNGEEIEKAATVRASDLLPSGWNSTPDSYTLSYRQDGTNDLFLLKVLIVDTSLFVQLLRRRDEKVVDMEIVTSEFISENLSSFETAYHSLKELTAKIEKELIGSVSESPRQAAENRPRADMNQKTPPSRDPSGAVPADPRHFYPNDPLRIGSSDLDPFGAGGLQGGGSMLFDPLRSGFPRRGPYDPNVGGIGGPTIPRGSVPPGARFDPFGPDMGPFGPGFNPHRSGPDPDHMKPPGFGDDMYM